MEVVGLCAACHRPGVLTGCPGCGAQVHPNCLETGRHMHGGPARGTGDAPDHKRPKV